VIKVDPIEPDDSEWKEWRKTAKAACDKIKAADRIDETLYKKMRGAILKLFHGKCAYCESHIEADQRFGDVEHYRPKGRVTDENYNPVVVRGKPHPGYYWLAYDWTNLFPACKACNQPGKDPDGTAAGKWDRFPIQNEAKRATKRNDPLEPPSETLLINPYVEEPADHLVFDPDTGEVAGTTAKGWATIRILGLRREGLRVARLRAAEAAHDVYTQYAIALLTDNERERARRKESIEEYERGDLPYSAVGREAIRKARENAKKSL